MYNENIFNGYLQDFTNFYAKSIVEQALKQCPPKFYVMPASSSGKYHPEFALGEGGLVRHTLAATYIAKELLNLEMFATLKESSDIIIAALILHDCVKQGKDPSDHTVFDHPEQASYLVRVIGNELCEYYEDFEYVDNANAIAELIVTHMGQWNKDFKTNRKLPKPKSQIQKFVHMCDYLASRKGDINVISYIRNKQN